MRRVGVVTDLNQRISHKRNIQLEVVGLYNPRSEKVVSNHERPIGFAHNAIMLTVRYTSHHINLVTQLVFLTGRKIYNIKNLFFRRFLPFVICLYIILQNSLLKLYSCGVRATYRGHKIRKKQMNSMTVL